MKVSHTISDARAEIREHRQRGETIGFVSTLGNLHDGHTSLVTAARHHCDYVVAGIFLNPTHFAAHEDFDKYPRTFREDCERLRAVGCDLVFAPSIEEMYPLGVERQAAVYVPGLSELYCGASRPHFFGAVATIVTKLLNILQPDIAPFGEKDYQQLLVVRRLVETLHIPTSILACPTVREPNGLAMSSRNNYLTAEQKNQAAELYRALCDARVAVMDGDLDFVRLSAGANARLERAGFQPDYFNFAHAETLASATADASRIVILAAAKLNGVRLIDNVVADRSEQGRGSKVKSSNAARHRGVPVRAA